MILATFLAIALAAGGTIADPAGCAAIAADAERLACYDRIFKTPARSEPAGASVPTPAAASAPPTAAPPATTTRTPEDEFGLTAGQLREQSSAGTLDRIRAEVTG